MDIRQGQVAPLNRLTDFGFYVSFFPQLVAGPIVRAADFVPQILKPANVTRATVGLAGFWILNGLLKKVLLAGLDCRQLQRPGFAARGPQRF